MARIRQETAEDEVANQRSMETAAAAAAFTLVIRRLAGDPDDETVKALNPNDLDPGEVARLGDFFVRTGRLALGQPTDVIKGGIAIHPAEVTRIVQQIVGHALKWMAADVPPAAMQEGFVRDVEALGGAS